MTKAGGKHILDETQRQLVKSIMGLEKSIKKYRGKNRLLYYKSHTKQETFHKSKAKNR